MKLGELCQIAGIDCPQSLFSIEISGVTSDSRQVREGSLFVCVKGFHYDGHSFIRRALCAGAVAIVAEEDAQGLVGDHASEEKCEFNVKDVSARIITVPKTRRALACLLDAWYGSPSKKMKYIAVTGTNGKTSVSCVLKKIFESALYRCGLIGTVSCMSGDKRLIAPNRDELANMTTPDPEQLYEMLGRMACDGVEYVFIEATSHALALDKLAPIKFEAGIFTNLTPEHLDFHGTMEAYLKAKCKLFAACRVAVINRDSEYYNEIAAHCCGKVVTCSAVGNSADYRAQNIEDDGVSGIGYTMCAARAVMKIKCRLPGLFSVMNTLEAAACAAELGIRPAVIAGAIASVNGIDGRLERVKLGYDADFSVFIDYAHTPDALENLLFSVRGFCRPGQRITVLFGCGGDRDHSKRPVMGEIATRLADTAVITSDNSRSEEPMDIIADILLGVGKRQNFRVIPDRREAIMRTVCEASAGDIIILAGKGHEIYEINRAGRLHFCERRIVAEAMERRRDSCRRDEHRIDEPKSCDADAADTGTINTDDG